MACQKLSGKVAVVTGGSRGIGRAASEALARHGASVVVNYCGTADAALDKAAAADDVVRRIVDAGGKAVAHEADIADEPAGRGLVDRAIDE